jgi:hypothetical protein
MKRLRRAEMWTSVSPWSPAVLVYDLASKALVFEDTNANSVAWNTEFEVGAYTRSCFSST